MLPMDPLVKNDTEELPELIGLKTREYLKEMRAWRRSNKRVPWAQFLRDALDGYYGRAPRKAPAGEAPMRGDVVIDASVPHGFSVQMAKPKKGKAA